MHSKFESPKRQGIKIPVHFSHLWTICVVEHSEDDLRQWVIGGRVVRRRHHLRQIVLQCLAEDRVERQVRPDDMLLHPHVRTKSFDLLPQAIEVLRETQFSNFKAQHIFLGPWCHLLLRMRHVRSENSQGAVMGLDAPLDISVQRSQHPIEFGFLFFVQFSANPWQCRQHRISKPVSANLTRVGEMTKRRGYRHRTDASLT